jgi:hypothetical protein
MPTVTFDTHKFVTRLREAGLEEKQAEAISEAFKEAQTQALETGVATRNDINELRRDMLEMELRLIKWGVGLALGQAAVVTTLVKLL